MYVRYERVCHTISGLKMLHPEDPPHIFWKPKKHVGGYISCGQVKYFSEISCLTPPNIPGLKGGIIFHIIRGPQPSARGSDRGKLTMVFVIRRVDSEGSVRQHRPPAESTIRPLLACCSRAAMWTPGGCMSLFLVDSRKQC